MPSAVFNKFGHLGEMPGIAGIQMTLDNGVVLWFHTPMFSGCTASRPAL
jgi:hypothetical protein